MMTWRTIENNGGGLALEVYEDDELVYAHSGYEMGGTLRQDIGALMSDDGCDLGDWDGNEVGDYESYPDGDRGDNNEWRVVASGDAKTATIEPWGAASRKALFV